MLASEDRQLLEACHAPVRIHDLADHGSGLQASEAAEGLENPTGQVDVLLLSALLSLEGENYTESIEITSRAGDMLPRVSPPIRQEMGKALAHLLAGVAEARTGNLESARPHREALGKINASLIFKSGELQSFGQNTLDGEIALASGDLDGAEAAFTSAEPELKMVALPIMNPIQTALLNNMPFRDGLARVKKARGDLAGAIEIYRKEGDQIDFSNELLELVGTDGQTVLATGAAGL